MNYIKIQNYYYINLDQVSYFKADSHDYYITFYCNDGNVLVVDFDYRNEYNALSCQLSALKQELLMLNK